MLSDNSFESNSVCMKGVNFNYFYTKNFEDIRALEITRKKDEAVKSRCVKKMASSFTFRLFRDVKISRILLGNYKAHSYFRQEKLIMIGHRNNLIITD